MHVTTLSGVLRCFILLGPLRASGYIRVLFNWAWKVFFLRRNVNVRKKKIWRLMSCYNARTDVNDIKCRIEPKTVALRLLCKSVYVVVLFPSVAKKCLIWYNAPPLPLPSAVPWSNGRKQGLAGRLGSRMDGTTVVNSVGMKSVSGSH